MNRIIKSALYWLPAFSYMALIFVLSSFPPPQAAREVPIYFNVKLIHIIEYGVLNLLVYWAISRTSSMTYGWRASYSVAIAVLYGLTDELHQVFVPGRSGQLIDIFANLIGCVSVQLGIFVCRMRSQRFCR